VFALLVFATQERQGKNSTSPLWNKAYFTHKTTYAYLPLFIGSCNMQEYLDLNIFWSGEGRFCDSFPPFCVFARHVVKLAIFLIAYSNCCLNCIHSDASRVWWRIWVNTQSSNFDSRKVEFFLRNPLITLLHPSPTSTPRFAYNRRQNIKLGVKNLKSRESLRACLSLNKHACKPQPQCHYHASHTKGDLTNGQWPCRPPV